MKKCKDCGKDFKQYSTLDKFCYDCKKNHIKPVKRISNKKKDRLISYGGEIDLFRKIWNKRHHQCCICGSNIGEPSPVCFAHILSKKDFPYLRYFENNIALVCNVICHTTLDKKVVGNKKDIEQKILKGDFIY